MFGSNNEDRKTSHNDGANEQKNEEKATEREEEIGKERANKMARVKWGRGKREANGK